MIPLDNSHNSKHPTLPNPNINEFPIYLAVKANTGIPRFQVYLTQELFQSKIEILKFLSQATEIKKLETNFICITPLRWQRGITF